MSSVLAMTRLGVAVWATYSMPAGTGRVATTFLTALLSGFLYSAMYSITSPGFAVSPGCFNSVPSIFTILLATSRTLTSDCSGRYRANAAAITNAVLAILVVYIKVHVSFIDNFSSVLLDIFCPQHPGEHPERAVFLW